MTKQALQVRQILTFHSFIEENFASKAADIKSQRDNSRNNNRRGPSQEMMQYWGMDWMQSLTETATDDSQATNSRQCLY
jgi:hypothetical protein